MQAHDYKYFRRRNLPPPLGKPITSKSPDIPAVYHRQKASPDEVADTDKNKRHFFASAFCQFLIFHSGILSILFILSVLSRFSTEIVLQALVTKLDVVRGLEQWAK